MKSKLFIIIIFIEIILFVSMTMIFTNNNYSDKVGIILVWLLPIIFGFHVVEEFALPGGFDIWYKEYRPDIAKSSTKAHFIKINILPAVLSILFAISTFVYSWMYSQIIIRLWFALLFIFTYNGILHIIGSIETKKYSPGMITGIILYFPLAIVSGIYFIYIRRIDFISLLICVIVGPLFWVLLERSKKHNT